jgi:hypothetical protein
MPLTPLSVISRALRTCPPPAFDWQGADPDEVVGEIDEDYIEEFKQVNSIAALAYVLAAVEWIYWYVRDHIDIDDARDYEEYIVAHWVWVCDLPRKVPPAPYETRDEDLRQNPVYYDAVEIGLESVSNGIYSLPHHETAVDAAFMSQLCEYIFPRKCGFVSWRIAVVERLKRKYPATRSQYTLTRVSRRLFDTDVDMNQINEESDCSEIRSNAELIIGNRYLPLQQPD